ncbi:hypothetical protein ACLB2K_044217 [Fragaria x ananassa]
MAELVGPRLYSCCKCRNHVALHDDIISKAFQWGLKKTDPSSLVCTRLRMSTAATAMNCWAGSMNEPLRKHRNTRKGNSF